MNTSINGIKSNKKTDLFFLSSDLVKIDVSLRTRIKLYKKRAKDIENFLSLKPEEWGKFQSEFNTEIDNFFRDIMNFEKNCIAKGDARKVQKLKNLFIKRIKKIFKRGVYCEWSILKPLGYAGDFKIIDDIYQNNPTTTGFDRLFDNYYQMSAISMAVRNRKEDFKRLMVDFINKRQAHSLRIMNLACGPCRELEEILLSSLLLNKNVVFDCYDHESRAIEFASKLLSGFPSVNFIKENALRIAVAKDPGSLIKQKYDLIYTMGLFDYFNHKISVRLIKKLKQLLKPEGKLIISNVRDKYSNPSVHFMEWAGDWNLVYRTDEEFKKIFIDSGFKEEKLKTQYEQQGIMQYIIASNTKI